MYPLVVRPLMRQLLYKVCICPDFICLKVIQILEIALFRLETEESIKRALPAAVDSFLMWISDLNQTCKIVLTVVRPLTRQLLYKVCIWSDFTCLKVIQIPVFFSRSATHEATFIQSLCLFGFYMFKSGSNSWNSYQKSTTSRGWQLFNMNFWPKSNMQNSAYRKLFDAFPPLALLLFSLNISIKRLKMNSKFLKMPIYDVKNFVYTDNPSQNIW